MWWSHRLRRRPATGGHVVRGGCGLGVGGRGDGTRAWKGAVGRTRRRASLKRKHLSLALSTVACRGHFSSSVAASPSPIRLPLVTLRGGRSPLGPMGAAGRSVRRRRRASWTHAAFRPFAAFRPWSRSWRHRRSALSPPPLLDAVPTKPRYGPTGDLKSGLNSASVLLTPAAKPEFLLVSLDPTTTTFSASPLGCVRWGDRIDGDTGGRDGGGGGRRWSPAAHALVVVRAAYGSDRIQSSRGSQPVHSWARAPGRSVG